MAPLNKPTHLWICPYDNSQCNTIMCDPMDDDKSKPNCEFLKLERSKAGTAISKIPHPNHEDSIGE